MITCNLMGGLGNQLFQIFATISYAIKSGNQFKFLNVDSLGEGTTIQRNTYWHTILKRLQPFLIKDLPETIRIIREKEFTYNDILPNITKENTIIYGYFQSYKYFKENYDIVCRIIGLDKLQKEILDKYNDIIPFGESVSIHFRIGDYKKLTHVYTLLNIHYYNNSIKYIIENDTGITTIVYFCENKDVNDVLPIINQLKDNYKKINFIRGDENLEDWQQLLLMSCCHHNILANSTFSWWGAYFNFWNNKIVCYPKAWFSKNMNTNDLCPLEWISIS